MARYAEDIIVDKKDQLEKIEGVCLPNEIIRAVFDLKGGGSGFIGLTDRRLIYYDKAFLKKKKAMVSLPYSRIACVASEDNSGFFIRSGFLVSDTLTIEPIGLEPRTFVFRGGDKAHRAHNIIMEYLLEE
jgi:hypothetical protein